VQLLPAGMGFGGLGCNAKPALAFLRGLKELSLGGDTIQGLPDGHCAIESREWDRRRVTRALRNASLAGNY